MRTHDQHIRYLRIGYPVLRGGKERYVTVLHRTEQYVQLDGDAERIPFSELQFSERLFEGKLDADGNVSVRELV